MIVNRVWREHEVSRPCSSTLRLTCFALQDSKRADHQHEKKERPLKAPYTGGLRPQHKNKSFGDYAILALSVDLAPSGGIYMQLERGKPPEISNAPYRVARIKARGGSRRDQVLNPGGHARG
jgi:hypothetical protein